MPQTTTDEQQPADASADNERESEIDIDKLAEKVYQLMLADLRLERARGVRPARRKGQL